MIIDRPTYRSLGAVQRIAAKVTWEDADRPPGELSFELPANTDLSDWDAGAFLIACVPLATRHGEYRVRIDAPVCPMLRDGLATAAGWLVHWNATYGRVPTIEATSPRSSPDPAPDRAAGFMSGGVDSTFMLQQNRRLYSEGDDNFIRDAFFLHGFDIGKRAHKPEDGTFERARVTLSRIADAERVNLIPVRTNVRQLDVDPAFWTFEFHGAVLAAAGHIATRGRLNLFIAATNDIRNMIPWGSHPYLDVNYGSQRVRVIHDCARFSRLDKVRSLSQTPHLIDNIRVCTANHDTLLNCGRCEKCVRTRLELLAVGQQHHLAFPDNRLSAETVVEIAYVANDYHAACYRDLVPLLEQQGYPDLAQAVSAKLQQYGSS